MLKVQQSEQVRNVRHGLDGERLPRSNIADIPPKVIGEATTLLKGEMPDKIDRLRRLS